LATIAANQYRFNPDAPIRLISRRKQAQVADQGTLNRRTRETRLKRLLKANSRDQLLAQAQAAGVEVGEAMKEAIAEALLDAKTPNRNSPC